MSACLLVLGSVGGRVEGPVGMVKVDTVNQLERSVLGSTAGGLAVLHPDVICGRRLL
jgi:hypothetical protein